MRIRLAMVLLVALALPASADAHAFLVSSTPASGASLARAPRIVTLRFTEPVSPTLTHVQIFDGRGTPRYGARVSEGRTANEVRVSLPRLATGAYRFTYSTVSEDDLHATTRRHRVRRRDRPPQRPGPRIRQRPERVSPRASRTSSICSRSRLLIGVCALLTGGLPAAVRSRITRFALVALPALLLAGVVALAGKSSQVPLQDALFGTGMGSRDARAGTRDRRRAGRARDTPAEARACAARARRGRRGREWTRRVARRSRTAHHDSAHPRGLPLGGRSHRARARPARAGAP